MAWSKTVVTPSHLYRSYNIFCSKPLIWAILKWLNKSDFTVQSTSVKEWFQQKYLSLHINTYLHFLYSSRNQVLFLLYMQAANLINLKISTLGFSCKVYWHCTHIWTASEIFHFTLAYHISVNCNGNTIKHTIWNWNWQLSKFSAWDD